MNRKVLALAFVFLLSPVAAFATYGNVVPIVDYPSGGGIVNGATFGMVGKSNHSYVCAISVTGADYSVSNSISTPSGASISGIRASSGTEATRYLNQIVGIDVSDVDHTDNLVFFAAPGGAAEYGKYSFTIGINSGTPSAISIDCLDTTILCDINTYLSQLNFLEMTSLGSKAGAATLKIIRPDGTEASIPVTLTFPSGLRRDVDIHSLAGPNTYGTLIIQALDFIPSLDGFLNPKMSVYKGGELRSSGSCHVPTILFA